MIHAYAAHEPRGMFVPFEYDPGHLGRNEVEIQVKHCGICHSDLSMLENAWSKTQYPLVAGHEIVGTVAAIGDEVTTMNVGDDVGLGWHSKYCMSCPTCLSGDHNLCGKSEETIVGRFGGFADRVRADAASVFKIPPGVDLESAGPLFCGGITVFNPLMQMNLRPTDKAAVIGIGGLGHLALQFLNAWGCEVTAFTTSENKIKEALSLGAHHTIHSHDSKAIQAAAGQFDLILSTVNVKLDWNSYIAALKPKGRLHIVGATLEPMDLYAFQLIAGQRSVSGTPVGSPATILKMLDFAARHQIKPIIETYALDQVNEAMERLKSGKAHYRLVLKV